MQQAKTAESRWHKSRRATGRAEDRPGHGNKQNSSPQGRSGPSRLPSKLEPAAENLPRSGQAVLRRYQPPSTSGINGIGGLHLVVFLAWGHGNNDVFAFFAIRFGNPKNELVLVHAKLCGLANGQKRGMFVVLRPNVVHDAITLQNVFLAQQ